VTAFDPFSVGAAAPPSPARKDSRTERAELAADGDAWGLFEAIRGEDPLMMDWDREFDQVFTALRHRVRAAPDQFVDEVFDHLLALGTYFTLRTQFFVEYKVRAADAQGRRRGGAYLPPDVAEIYLPRLMELGKYVSEIAHLKAATARQTALARAKRLPAESQAKSTRPASRLINGKAQQSLASNGHAHTDADGGATGPPSRGQAPPPQNGKPDRPANGHPTPSAPPYVNRLKGRRNGSPPES
jgi:hypothetical protein